MHHLLAKYYSFNIFAQYISGCVYCYMHVVILYTWANILTQAYIAILLKGVAITVLLFS